MCTLCTVLTDAVKNSRKKNISFPLILESANFNVSKIANIYVFNIWTRFCRLLRKSPTTLISRRFSRVPLWIWHCNLCMEIYSKIHLKFLGMNCRISYKSLCYQLQNIVQCCKYLINEKDKFNQFKCQKTNCFPLDQSINQLIEEWSPLNII